MKKVSKEEIRHIANLARLELNEDEIDNYKETLKLINNYLEYKSNFKKFEPHQRAMNS